MVDKLVEAPLPFKVAFPTADGVWTVKSAHDSEALAGAAAFGFAHSGVPVRVYHEGIDITQRAVQLAHNAMQAAMKGRT